ARAGPAGARLAWGSRAAAADAALRQPGLRAGPARAGGRAELPSLTFGGRSRMAHAPKDLLQTIERFGPHVAYSAGERLDSGVVPDRVVHTHCCFCGQQCGMKLLVKDDTVLGVEPWYEFPFNRGMLCPKGVKR